MPPTSEELEELRESFRYNDANDDGKIDFDEFVNMLKDLEAGIEAQAARLGFDEIDTDDDQAIEFEEFVAWWTDR